MVLLITNKRGNLTNTNIEGCNITLGIIPKEKNKEHVITCFGGSEISHSNPCVQNMLSWEYMVPHGQVEDTYTEWKKVRWSLCRRIARI